jgi:hypothetical protein
MCYEREPRRQSHWNHLGIATKGLSMKQIGIRWITGAYPKSIDVFELSDLDATSQPRIVQHQVFLPNGDLYGIATCSVVADDVSATIDYAPFAEANSNPEMHLGATKLCFVRNDAGLKILDILWRDPGNSNFEPAEFKPYSPSSKIANKVDIDASQALMRSAAMRLSHEELLSKLPVKDSIPAKISVTTTAFVRNPYVIEAALRRADGICGDCNVVPFKSKCTGLPYLEVHHIQPLSEGGSDSLENTVALCPNCHKRRHFG